MKVQGVGYVSFSPSPRDHALPKFRSNDFDPDISLERQGNCYKYSSKQEQKRKRELAKMKMQEIATAKKKNIIANASNLLGLQIFNKILNKQKSEGLLKINQPAHTQKIKESSEIKKPETSRVNGTNKHSLLSRNVDILQKDSKLQTTREQYNTALSQKLFEIESNRLEVRRSNKMLKKILQNWGKSKAKREENWLLKQSNNQKSMSKINKSDKIKDSIQQAMTPPTFDVDKNEDSDSTLSADEISETNNFKSFEACKSVTDHSKFPILKKKTKVKQPKVVDFSNNVEEMNANQFDEYGNPYFNMCLDSNKSPSTSPVREKQSKLRSYFNNKLCSHMMDFRNDGKAKINAIRNKYPWTKLK